MQKIRNFFLLEQNNLFHLSFSLSLSLLDATFVCFFSSRPSTAKVKKRSIFFGHQALQGTKATAVFQGDEVEREREREKERERNLKKREQATNKNDSSASRSTVATKKQNRRVISEDGSPLARSSQMEAIASFKMRER